MERRIAQHPRPQPHMPGILTSWKEIAQFLGKGVRTVQRWEREAGLPVRRHIEPARHAVLAIPDELDSWVRSRTRGPSGALAGALQKEIASLHAQNSGLRARLDVLEQAVVAMSAAGVSANNGHLRPEAAAAASATGLSGDLANARSESRRIRFTAQQGRARAIRARLSFASTLCALSETGAVSGEPATMRRIQHAALEIRRSLESPGCVPPNEVDDLRALLRELELRITLILKLSPRDPGAAGTYPQANNGLNGYKRSVTAPRVGRRRG